MHRVICLSILVALMLVGCSEKTTNNYFPLDSGCITGRISPVDPGTIVSTDDGSVQTSVNAEGYFIIDGLSSGVYHIVVQPVNYSRRGISGIVVTAGHIRDIGRVVLSILPYPIYRTEPYDGQDSVRLYNILLYTDEELDIEDLTAGTTVQPPLTGEWSVIEDVYGYGYDGGYAYRYHVSSYTYPVGTTFTVRIDSAVRTLAGVPLGSEARFSFTTEPLDVSVRLPNEGRLGGIPIWDFQPRLSFSTGVIFDSVKNAVAFEPTIEGYWFPDSYPESSNVYRRFRFNIANEPLEPVTSYNIIIKSDVELGDGVSLLSPDTTTFVTEPYGVTEMYPYYSWNIDPNIDIRLTFNVSMDTASTESSFSLVESEGDPVQGTFYWPMGGTMMFFDPDETLRPDVFYRMTLTTDARTIYGENLASGVELLFAVR